MIGSIDSAVTPGPSEDIGYKFIREVQSGLIVPGSVVEKNVPWFTSANVESKVIHNQNRQTPEINFHNYSHSQSTC